MSQRVLFLEHNMDGTVGGSHYCLLEICRNIDRQRFQPVVYFSQENTLLEDFRCSGAEVVVQPPVPPLRLHGRYALLQSAANAYRTLVSGSARWSRTLDQQRIDLVHLNNNCAADHDLVLGARRRGIPCLAHQRGFPMGVTGVHRLLARCFERIISISNAVTDDLRRQRLPTDRVVLVHDGIDPARIVAKADNAGTRAQWGIPAEAPVVGVVGNVKAWKGQETLVRAMQHVLREYPETRCLVVGSIADRAYYELLQRHVAAAGMGERIVFAGYQRYPAAYMSAMDVVVHTSVEPEPFGIVILEGMALCKPVVATAHGGPLDVIADGVTGFLTPPRDDVALAKVLCGLLADPGRRERIGAAGRQRLESQFTARHNVAQIERIYDEILQPRS